MKKITILLTVLVSVAFASPAITAKTPTNAATIAILDVNQILAESKAAKGLNEQMNNLRESYEKDIYKKEEELRAKEKELEKLSGAKLEKARSALEAQVAEFQKTIMNQQGQLQQAAQDAMDQIRDKVVSISNEIAKGKGYTYVQPAAAFLFFPDETDITKDTIAKLDKELPSVKVNIKATA